MTEYVDQVESLIGMNTITRRNLIADSLTKVKKNQAVSKHASKSEYKEMDSFINYKLKETNRMIIEAEQRRKEKIRAIIEEYGSL